VLRVIKPLHELAGWIVDDSRIPAAADLPEHLCQKCGLPSSGVTDDLHVLGLGPCGNAEHSLHIVGFETDAVALHGAVELAWRQHLGPFQTAAVLQLLLPLHIFYGRERKEDEKERGTAD
jgi:hypothetical protein